MDCVQTDNGSEFTNFFFNSRKEFSTMFQLSAQQLFLRHKLIRPYTPGHSGKMERSHRDRP